jgi:DNA polymerase-1
MFESLDKDAHKASSPNDKILLCDGLNTFIRSFVVNPTINENGIHIGGISGFLQSLGYAIRNIAPTRVIICFDGKGGSQRRRKLFPNYKAQRRMGDGKKRMTRVNSYNNAEDERLSMHHQLARLTEYLETLPLDVVIVENIEADDSIAYATEQLFPDSECVIMSTDKDYLQLVSDRVFVWSPTKKKYYNKQSLKEEYEIPAYNFLMYKILTGDSSDNIPGIKGIGLKTLRKRLPIIFDKKVDIDDIVKYSNDHRDEAKILEIVADNKELLELNFKLMQLFDVNISGSAKRSIKNQVSKKSSLLKYKFQILMLEDMLNTAIKNPDVWLRETFKKLDVYRTMLNEDTK